MITISQKRRKAALARYYSAPNICEHCGKVIAVENGKKVQTAQRKRFCARACWLEDLRSKKHKQSNCQRSCQCRSCGRVYVWDREKGHTLAKCNSCLQAETRRRRKARAVAYLGGKCSCCGYDRHLAALDFHHRDPSRKKFNLSTRALTLSWVKLKRELDKCTLLCANCHREVHALIVPACVGVTALEDF